MMLSDKTEGLEEVLAPYTQLDKTRSGTKGVIALHNPNFSYELAPFKNILHTVSSAAFTPSEFTTF